MRRCCAGRLAGPRRSCGGAASRSRRHSNPSSSSCCSTTSEAHSLVVLRDTDGTLLVRAADLAQLRLKKPARGVLTVDGERYVRLGRRWAPRAVRRRGAARPRQPAAAAFLPTRTVTRSPDLPPVTTASLGGFVNYDLYGEQIDRRPASARFSTRRLRPARRRDELAAGPS